MIWYSFIVNIIILIMETSAVKIRTLQVRQI